MDNEYVSTLLPEDIPGLDGIGALVAMLDLGDTEFESMKPLLLEELEKGFNNSNDKYNLAFALNSSGYSAAELRQTFNQIISEIDTKFENYNESRRDFLKQIFSMLVNSLETGKGLHNRIIRIPMELCHPDAHLPTYAHDGDAGCDVYCLDDYTVEPHQTMILPLGFKVAIPHGYEIQMRPRSGMSAKTKIRIANAPGTIDAGYRGEVGVIIDNIGDYPYYITKGQKVAQMVLSEVPVASFYTVDSISSFESERGSGGYGSSGK